jgi:hypothetical protein
MTTAADLFGLPPTDVSVVSSNDIIITPTYDTKEDTNPLHFRVPASSMQYMDLSASRLYIKVKILNKDGTNLAAGDAVAPSNMFYYAMFKNCDVYLNGTLISTHENLYPYQAGLPTLLTNGQGEKDTELSSILFYRDMPPDVFDPTRNAGFRARQELSAASRVFDMLGTIPVDLCQQAKFLPTFCNLTFELGRQNPEFCIDSATSNKQYKYEIVSAEMHVRMHTMNPELIARHNKLFQTEKAQYPLLHLVVRTAIIPTGVYSFTNQSLINGKLPTTVVFGMLSESSFRGTHNKSPWNFQNFGLSSISTTWDNNPAMARQIKVDFTNKCYLLGYQSLFKALARKSAGNYISRSDYASGNTLFLFDVQTTVGSEFHTAQKAELKVSLEFPVATTETIILVMFATVEGLLEIDKFRNVYIKT